MNKFMKFGYAVVLLLSMSFVVGCTSTSFESNNVIDTLVDNNIITLPSINLDFVNNERIEITDALLNKWNNTAPAVVSQLKERLDFRSNIKHYISDKMPEMGEDWFPISMETVNGIKTLYVISQML